MDNDFCVITFADKEPYISESKNLEFLCKTSNINFKRYDFNWLKNTQEYEDNLSFFQNKKRGYCAWKPMIIIDALKDYKQILYLDSSMLFIPESLIEYRKHKESILSTETPLKNSLYTKKETFNIMKCTSKRYKEANQVWAGTILSNRKSIKFLRKWLFYCLIENCVSDVYSKEDEPEIKYCLFDQGIYSILYEKYHKKRIDNCKEGNFSDTREASHRKFIEKIFGIDVIKNQDDLIRKNIYTYCSNASRVYIPENMVVT